MKALEGVGEQNQALRSVILLNLSQVQWWLADPAALATAAEAMDMSERTGNPFGAMNALGTRSQILLMLGKLKEAQVLCEKSIQRYTLPLGQYAPLAAIPLVTLGIAAMEQDNFAEAEDLLRQGIELSEQSGNHVPLISGNLALIGTLQSLGRREEATALLIELKQIAQHFGASAMVEALEAELRLANGDLAFARCWAKRLNLRLDDTSHHMQEGTYLVFAQLLLAEGKPDDALPLLNLIEQSARQHEQMGTAIHALILQSIAQEKLDEEKKALAAMDEALKLAAPEILRRPFLIHLPEIESLLSQLSPLQTRFLNTEPTISHPTLSPPFAYTQDKPPHPSGKIIPISQSPSLPEALSERELDVLRLMAIGRSNPEIAEKLIVGVGTVKTHVHNILGKLGVRNRVEAIEAAKQIGLI